MSKGKTRSTVTSDFKNPAWLRAVAEAVGGSKYTMSVWIRCLVIHELANSPGVRSNIELVGSAPEDPSVAKSIVMAVRHHIETVAGTKVPLTDAGHTDTLRAQSNQTKGIHDDH